MIFGVITAEGVDGVGDEVSGDTTTFDVQTLLEAFSDMSQRPVCYADEVFLVKSKTSCLGDYFHQVQDYQHF